MGDRWIVTPSAKLSTTILRSIEDSNVGEESGGRPILQGKGKLLTPEKQCFPLAFLHCLPITSSNSHCRGQRAGEDGNPPGAPAVLSSQWSLTNQVGKTH